MKNILLVDDHPLMRKGLAMTLEAEADLHIMAQVESAEEAIDAVNQQVPDIAIVDISLARNERARADQALAGASSRVADPRRLPS
jgi:DNA-binding NarL/FixJ family response regulator